MPRLEYITDGLRNLKNGRSPAMDEVAIGILREIKRTGEGIHKEFTNTKYPPRLNPGGTKRGREHLYNTGDEDIPSDLIREEADKDHDGKLTGETTAKKARFSCAKLKRRKKRALCSLEEISDKRKVDEKSIRVTDSNIELDVVDRRDAKKRTHVEIPVTADDLATPKRIKETAQKAQRAGVSEKYAKVNKGLAVHGMIFSALGALDYFSRGDNVRGGIAVSQSLHTLGGLTGINEIAAKAGKKLLRYTALKVAKGLQMEEGLERFSGKVEKFMEKGVGKLMGDIPGVGLAFDIYFIEQDVEALANLDLNNPADVKMLPLRVVDLVLDVDTTVLNLIGTFCPEAEVITEPLVIVLSIIRMAIDDFYIDIMEEMDKVNWKSPWAGLEFIGALVKGFLEGAADFLSGGLRREMVSYKAQVDADKKLLSDLRNTENYYQVVGSKGGKGETIDFTQGRLSSFGGFINFRLFDDGWATLEIGDSTGSHEPIKRKIKVDKDLTEIILGIGETRDFIYKTKTAKLWFVIPIKDYNVICSANLHTSSLYGTYYGNSKTNKFFAIQNQKMTTTPAPSNGNEDSEECNYGKIDIKFVTGNYHYNLYGRGGDDIFYLGPQMSRVTGGEGSDIYILQSDSGRTVIDNFAEDNKRDMVVINVLFQQISCKKSGINLDVTYAQSHHIRINNWFLPGDPNYYRHVSFRSRDGVIFVPKEVVPTTSKVATHVSCRAVTIDKSSQESAETITVESPIYNQVKQVVGSNHSDVITGNDLNNILDGGRGADHLSGGRYLHYSSKRRL
ncbi:hypothetical protein QZH41_002754 [Actinostola sp. cb2023]|nr:hypothetical protein QZH41_002754 [Actinostola sp. cb2023]